MPEYSLFNESGCFTFINNTHHFHLEIGHHSPFVGTEIKITLKPQAYLTAFWGSEEIYVFG